MSVAFNASFLDFKPNIYGMAPGERGDCIWLEATHAELEPKTAFSL